MGTLDEQRESMLHGLSQGNDRLVTNNIRSGLTARMATDVCSFFAELNESEPTRLYDCSQLAARLQLRRLWIKDESTRMGVNSFKGLGAMYSSYRVLSRYLGYGDANLPSATDLERELKSRPHNLTFVTATAANYGRAIAHAARHWGVACRVYVPESTTAARVAAIESEGAACVRVPGTFDDATQAAATAADASTLLMNELDDDVSRWVIDGYSMMLSEIQEQLRSASAQPLALVLVQMGCGALAAAVARYFDPAAARPMLIGIEGDTADCVQTSFRAGRLTTVDRVFTSAMTGLDCGTPSAVAWPDLVAAVDAVLRIPDEAAWQGMRELAAAGLATAETGAAGVGGLFYLAANYRELIPVDGEVLVFVTEGATDPSSFRAIVGRDPGDVVSQALLA